MPEASVPLDPSWAVESPTVSEQVHVDTAGLPLEAVERIARQVAEQIGEKVIREIAWRVVPDLAERLVLERIRQIEKETG